MHLAYDLAGVLTITRYSCRICWIGARFPTCITRSGYSLLHCERQRLATVGPDVYAALEALRSASIQTGPESGAYRLPGPRL